MHLLFTVRFAVTREIGLPPPGISCSSDWFAAAALPGDTLVNDISTPSRYFYQDVITLEIVFVTTKPVSLLSLRCYSPKKLAI